jgi:hypothetical protein
MTTRTALALLPALRLLLTAYPLAAARATDPTRQDEMLGLAGSMYQ